jgi:hypothetical protein
MKIRDRLKPQKSWFGNKFRDGEAASAKEQPRLRPQLGRLGSPGLDKDGRDRWKLPAL